MDGKNYFTPSVIADMFNTTISNVNKHIRHFKKHVTNSHNLIKIGGSRNNLSYYDFTVITWLSGRINTKEAINMCMIAGELLNDKFNSTLEKSKFIYYKIWSVIR